MKQHNFKHALRFALASKDRALIAVVGHNGAVYEIDHGNYAAARRFAKHTTERDKLARSSWQAEGHRQYQQHHYKSAIKAYKKTHDKALVQQCYEALFFQEQAKLGSSLTSEVIRQHSSTIRRMHSYAKKSGNKSLVKHANKLRKYL